VALKESKTFSSFSRPYADGAIEGSGGYTNAIECYCVDVVYVPSKVVYTTTGGEVPYSTGAIVGTGSDAIAGYFDASYGMLVPSKKVQMLTSFDVPHSKC